MDFLNQIPQIISLMGPEHGLANILLFSGGAALATAAVFSFVNRVGKLLTPSPKPDLTERWEQLKRDERQTA
ncbi:hypothetical protein [Desulfohalovibrio reitneri]|uniref:hypothetical protein n=1 Tax=Desulfohalovibrio reitneri TaxID=1307759 RepID=UPI0004A75B8C|nr:hypothetical protein [Desulfohalovibrio reitneri]